MKLKRLFYVYYRYILKVILGNILPIPCLTSEKDESGQ